MSSEVKIEDFLVGLFHVELHIPGRVFGNFITRFVNAIFFQHVWSACNSDCPFHRLRQCSSGKSIDFEQQNSEGIQVQTDCSFWGKEEGKESSDSEKGRKTT